MFHSFVSDVSMNAAPKQTGLRFEMISDRVSLEKFAPSWRALLNRSQPEAMQSPDWLLTWWDIYGEGTDRQLRVGTFWSDGELVGMAPLCRRTVTYRGGLRFRRLEFLGSDVDENDGVCSEYLGLNTAPGFEQQVVEATVHQMARGAFGAWDEILLSAMNGASDQPRHLAEAFEQADMRVHLEETTSAPYVKLPDTWDAYIKQLSKSKRWNLKTQQKEFDAWAAGEAVWREVRPADELDRAMTMLSDLHEIRWKAEGKTGVFAAARFRAFHDRFARLMLDQGKLELIWVERADRPLAAVYAFREAGRVYYYQSGRVMDLPDKVRVGSLLVAHAIRRAIERGDKEFDLLGGPARYKFTFTDLTRPIIRLRVARPGLRETTRTAGEKMLRGLRNLKSWWKRPTTAEKGQTVGEG